MCLADKPVRQGRLGMFRRFLKDVGGNYLLLMAI
jgi:Flp pilus assembly protein TadG